MFCIVEYLSIMASRTRCPPRHVNLMFVCAVVYLEATLLCVLGIYFQINAEPKVRYYKESICQVETTNHRKLIYTYKPLSREDTYFVPVWNVKHSGPEFINATIQPDDGLQTLNKTLAAIDRYPVGFVSRRSP